MSTSESYILTRDTEATIIPAGEVHTLPAGTEVTISQALGGTVTIRTASGLFRVASQDWDALGEETAAKLAEAQSEAEQTAQSDAPFSEELIWEALRGCYDPEIPVNIVDLGLIYDLRASEPDAEGQHSVAVKMTLTAQGCGMGPVIAEDAKTRIEALPAVSEAGVEVVWDPPWSPHMISPEGRSKLGLD
ncbi:MAG: putative Fe-S cluster assembly protein SufT [Coraliomargarita sp. TMED73]|jgi:probable FeS assembly SUF system protein SufT|nr:MAG: putative Fe-S cluster assembly protein SufT [Coraliomargarita sp. TMED73]|tara:strand:+ start:2628 stop:3197 length:570 start_codon:yes stop_codon:yes gene_type:complete